MRQLLVREEAELDLVEAALHYERERQGLGLRFERELNHVLGLLQTSPRQFPEIETGVRRALVRTFPYGVFFSLEDETILVLAVLHLRRHPQTWKGRL
jgi:plasmid stabilization system protein ParE